MLQRVIIVFVLFTFANTQGGSVLNLDNLNLVFKEAKEFIKSIKPVENNATLNFTKFYERHHFQQSPTNRSKDLEKHQLLFEAITRFAVKKFNLTVQQIAAGLKNIPLKGDIDKATKECKNHFTCVCKDPKNSKYRTPDGSCNNINNPSWGRASTCFKRLLNPNYADGISEIKKSKCKKDLPLPREISTNVHSDLSRPTSDITHMCMAWGQFSDHDMTLTPFSNAENGQPIQCCPSSKNNHPQCAPILISSNDSFYREFNTTCLNFVRSSPCPLCNLGPRQQINQATAFVDGSMIYGTSANQTADLRETDGSGKLKINENCKSGQLLPKSPCNDGCSRCDLNKTCFKAGDPRVNENPLLTSLQTLFLREHNRLVENLKKINPHWDGERCFQEARRIIGANIQMIMYNEFLPIIFGVSAMKAQNLNIRKDGCTKYDPNVEPTIMTEFSTAAYRFGHSLIATNFQKVVGENGRQIILLRNSFFNSFSLHDEGISPLLRGLTCSPAEKFDRWMVTDVTGHLYKRSESKFGSDLASLNIQRGRDHGIPGYIKYVEACSGQKIKKFEDLKKLMTDDNIKILKRVYGCVDDIDLFTGGLSENVTSGLLGPTFVCILSKQFYSLKYGDRYYFEHCNQKGSFSEEQRKELRKTSLARIMCDNNKEIKEIQPAVMKFISKSNPQKKCSEIPGIDLKKWRENSVVKKISKKKESVKNKFKKN